MNDKHKYKFGIAVDEHGHDTWSFGCCISHDWFKQTYLFINFLWWSISIGWLRKESEATNE